LLCGVCHRARVRTTRWLAKTSLEKRRHFPTGSNVDTSGSSPPAAGTLTFKIENAFFPNWEGAEQKRTFELSGDALIYRVPARPDGNIPISVWRRLEKGSRDVKPSRFNHRFDFLPEPYVIKPLDWTGRPRIMLAAGSGVRERYGTTPRRHRLR
jgi:hypothetical protein